MSAKRAGPLRRLLNWFLVEEPAEDASRPDADLSPARVAAGQPRGPLAKEPEGGADGEPVPGAPVSREQPPAPATYPPPWATGQEAPGQVPATSDTDAGAAHGAVSGEAPSPEAEPWRTEDDPLGAEAPSATQESPDVAAGAAYIAASRRRVPLVRRRGLLRRMTDWFFVYEDGTPEGDDEDFAAGSVPPARRAGSIIAWVVVVIGIGVVGAVIVKGLPRRAAPVAAATHAATATVATATATATPTVTAAQLAADVNRAKTAASNASQSAQAAAAAARRVSGLLASAQADAKHILAVADPGLARDPQAADPSKALTPLQQVETLSRQAVNAIESDATVADGAANAATSLARTAPAAAASGDAASSAADQANQALTTAQQDQGQIEALFSTAKAAVATWEQVHSAPSGVLGVTVGNPAPTLGVQGCEVLSVEPGSAASAAGLRGAAQTQNGAGDVITGIADATDANATWTVTDCATLQAAMARTRTGDNVVVTYLQSRNLVFGRQWVQTSGTAVLGQGAPATGTATATSTATGTATATASGTAAATGTATATASGGATATPTATATSGGGTATGTATAQASCPTPISGTITPVAAGSRIELPITLAGPGGAAPNLRAILDTGGVATTFPDGLLRQLGYKPYGTTENSGVVPGATATAYLYHVPGSDITTMDGGQQVPLATGVLNVIGIPGGSNYTLGPDILEAGSQLSTSGSRWTLTPPCG